MELREIEIFLTLAEELHFGRTAEKLRITTSRVSQSIKKQERLIGGRLFERTSRHVKLTSLGEQLRKELAGGYQQIIEGIGTVRSKARGTTDTLRLGVWGPHVYYELDHIYDLFRSRHPGCEFTYREIQINDPFGPLRAGEIDVQTLALPVREPDITVGPVVLTDHKMLAVADSHPLAARDSACLEDLADCVVPQVTPDLPIYWEESILPFRTPGGRDVIRGPRVHTFQELLAVVVANQAVCVVFGEADRYYRRPGVTYLPIRDAPAMEWVLLWRTAAETPLIRAFAQAAADAGQAYDHVTLARRRLPRSPAASPRRRYRR